MQTVAIITGGAGGMGLATARRLGATHRIVISDVKPERLDAAVASLGEQDIASRAVVCDVTDRNSVDALFNQAATLGPVSTVIHTAGLSPQMADAETILRVNALGTIHISEAFHPMASEGSALVHVSSMSAYLLPDLLVPKRAFAHAFTRPDRLIRKIMSRVRLMPNGLYRTGMAYAVSKRFVQWYCQASAGRFGEKGARILSVSPGTFDTEMGRLEEKSGAADMLKTAALKRPGRPEEIAALIAFCASSEASYITGVDILCDGGVVAGRQR